MDFILRSFNFSSNSAMEEKVKTMEKEVKAMKELLTDITFKVNYLMMIPKISEADKQESIKLEMELEQIKMDNERQMRDEAWKREDEIRAEDKLNEEIKQRNQIEIRYMEINFEREKLGLDLLIDKKILTDNSSHEK